MFRKWRVRRVEVHNKKVERKGSSKQFGMAGSEPNRHDQTAAAAARHEEEMANSGTDGHV
jgi:hypothetical protein